MLLDEHQLDLIHRLQSMGLMPTMEVITRLGSFELIVAVAGVIYWSVSPRLGARLAIAAVLSSPLNRGLKLVLGAPRPFWLDTRLLIPSDPSFSYGMPSGHAQSTGVLYGGLAAWCSSPVVRGLALCVVVLVGASRVVLGLHSVGQVLAGWVVAVVVVWCVSRWGPGGRRRHRLWTARTAAVAVVAVAALTLVVGAGLTARAHARGPDPAWVASLAERGLYQDQEIAEEFSSGSEYSDWLEDVGLFVGVSAGLLAAWQRGLIHPLDRLSLARRALRSVVGGIGVVVISVGSAVFGAADLVTSAVLGLWMAYAVPQILAAHRHASSVLR
ncbi:MAG: phosphatase PAP2 family protein [Actinomycetota bacterium]